MEKQEQILIAALPLFVEFGFHGTPTSRIAEEAGVSNGTLFHYYSTKEELVIALYNAVKDDLSAFISPSQAALEGDFEQVFRAVFSRSITWAMNNRDAFHYIHQFQFSPHASQLSRETLEGQSRSYLLLIERGVAEGVLKPLSPDLLYTMISSHIFGLYQFLIMLDAEDNKKYITQSEDLLWDMLKV